MFYDCFRPRSDKTIVSSVDALRSLKVAVRISSMVCLFPWFSIIFHVHEQIAVDGQLP